jgi:hypothetical protein
LRIEDVPSTVIDMAWRIFDGTSEEEDDPDPRRAAGML